MELPRLIARAIIFDIYGTLLEVGPPPPDAEASWQELCLEMLHFEPHHSRLEFSIACNQVIARHQDVSRAHGIPWPEVHWPSIVAEVLPEFAQLSLPDQEEFLFRQIQTGRTTRMTDEAAAALKWLKGRSKLLGIASNAQAYTLEELQDALTSHGLGMGMFERDLCFWSFKHGFSKPDPHVFQILVARLAALGISPRETLMVGDRLDNDIEPARALGWRTWHLVPSTVCERSGSWLQLRQWLSQSRAND